MLTVFVIGDEERKVFKELADMASQKENWFDGDAFAASKIATVPGSDDKFVRVLGDVRCVFSWTIYRSKKQLFRHLTMSVLGQPDRMPSIFVAHEVARMLGFTGDSDGWMHQQLDNGETKVGAIAQLLDYQLYVSDAA